jgi:flavodoxin
LASLPRGFTAGSQHEVDMKRVLIEFFSMGGHTRQLAEEIQGATHAEMEEIVEPHPRHGVPGMLRAVWDASLHRKTAILPAKHNPADYDLLVLGGPVWAGRMAAPVRTFAEQNGPRAKQVAFFCTEGSSGATSAFADLERLSHQKPIATLVVDAKHLPATDHRSELGRFVASLRRVENVGAVRRTGPPAGGANA